MFNPYDEFADFEDFVAYECAYPEYEPPKNKRIEDFWYDEPDEEWIRFLASMSDDEYEEYSKKLAEEEGEDF